MLDLVALEHNPKDSSWNYRDETFAGCMQKGWQFELGMAAEYFLLLEKTRRSNFHLLSTIYIFPEA